MYTWRVVWGTFCKTLGALENSCGSAGEDSLREGGECRHITKAVKPGQRVGG